MRRDALNMRELAAPLGRRRRGGEIPIGVAAIRGLQEKLLAIEGDARYPRRPEDEASSEDRDLEPARRKHFRLTAPARIGDVDIVDDDLRRGAPADDKRPGDTDLPTDRRADGMPDEPGNGPPAAQPQRGRRPAPHDHQAGHQPAKDLD